MKKVRVYPVLGEESHIYTEISELVLRLPSFMLVVSSTKNFPQLPVLNDLFSKKAINEGMAGALEWDSFTIDEAEYAELKIKIAKKLNINFADNAELDILVCYSDWFSKSLKFCMKR